MKQVDVLIVDDEQKFSDMLSRRLTLRGLSCATCPDGTSAVNWFKEIPSAASLVLLDLHLPDIYGTQVMAEIKKTNPDIPIVIVTGHGTDTDRKECMRMGAHAFENKPVSIDTIMRFLKTIKGEPE